MNSATNWAESILRARAPELLKELSSPEADPDIELGEVGYTKKQWERAAKLMAAALSVVIETCRQEIEKDRADLVKAARWQLFSDIVGVIGPASLFVVLRADWPQVASYLSAGITLLALILAVTAGSFTRAPGKAGTLLDHHQELISCKAEALSVLRQIELDLACNVFRPEHEDLIIRAGEVCRRVDEATA